MFEARLVQGNLLKKLCDGLKDLVTEVNLDVSSTGIQCQAMDSSHVCLVATQLRADGFDHFRCDRNLTLGVSIPNLAKVLKCAGGRGAVGPQHAQHDQRAKPSAAPLLQTIMHCRLK
jgi:proliferating cell nuclear antigen